MAENCTDEQMVVRRLAQEAKRTIRELSGFDVKLGLPGLVGDAVDRLYEEGRACLAGSERPGVPL
jgi:hypothetical protein